MTNKNDNRQRKNKYPKKSDTEFNKETDIRSEITKRDLQIKSK